MQYATILLFPSRRYLVFTLTLTTALRGIVGVGALSSFSFAARRFPSSVSIARRRPAATLPFLPRGGCFRAAAEGDSSEVVAEPEPLTGWLHNIKPKQRPAPMPANDSTTRR
jgi:hypothetical protein